MTGWSFRRAGVGARDVAAAQDAYRRIIDHIGETGGPSRWNEVGHPKPEQVAAWAEAGELYVALDGEQIAGVVVLNYEAIDAYATADWAVEASASEALVVHALGVVPAYLGQGVARFLLDSALDVAREAGCRAVRLDVYVENTPALRLYRSYGFRDLGCHTVDYGDIDLNDFHLFEYVI